MAKVVISYTDREPDLTVLAAKFHCVSSLTPTPEQLEAGGITGMVGNTKLGDFIFRKETTLVNDGVVYCNFFQAEDGSAVSTNLPITVAYKAGEYFFSLYNTTVNIPQPGIYIPAFNEDQKGMQLILWWQSVNLRTNPLAMQLGWLTGKRVAQQRIVTPWEVIFDGTVATVADEDGCYSASLQLAKMLADTGVYRLTVDGVSHEFTAAINEHNLSCPVFIGNLVLYYAYDDVADTGFDFLVYDKEFFSRSPGRYHIRVEKKLGIENIYDQLYCNGTICPAIPKQITKEYPYLAIYHALFAMAVYASKTPFVLNAEGRVTNGSDGTAMVATCGTLLISVNSWENWSEGNTSDIPNSDWIFWANHDILYEDGMVYLAGTEPVPYT